jgi:transposase
MMKAAIQELDWEILPRPPYSPDLAPADYHLFRLLSNNLRGAKFPSTKSLRSKIGSTTYSRPNRQFFFNRGIENLPEC